MMWLKPTKQDWNVPLSYIFNIPGSFDCYAQQKQIVCESSQKADKLLTNTSSIFQNDWFHLTVSGKKLIGSYLLLEDHVNVIDSDSKSYVNLQQSKQGWAACIGSCDNSFGFNGGFRDFIFITEFLTLGTANRMKNHYLTWDLSIIGYFRFNSERFQFDEFRHQEMTIYNPDSSKIQEFDYIINDICYPFQDYQDFMYFSEDSIIESQNVDGRWNASLRNYGYTLSLWINPSPDNCFTTNPLYAKENCSTFIFNDIVTLYFESATIAKFYFDAQNPAFEIRSQAIFVPMRQWINIQLSFSHYYGYEIKTFDIQGRLMQSFSRNYDMMPQFPIQKNITFFQHFRGYVRNFVLFAEAKDLPLKLDMEETIYDSSCLYYLKFQPQYNNKSMKISNYGGGSKTQNLILSKNPSYKKVLWEDFPLGTTKTLGLTSYPYQLFDGIACNDKDQTVQLQNSKSFFHTQVKKQGNLIRKSMTVEFWFRPHKFNTINTLFQLYSNNTKQQYLEIAMSSELYLNCAPFGIQSQSSPYIQFEEFNETTFKNNTWIHIACSYTQKEEVNAYFSLSGNTFVHNLNISDVANYIPGNSNIDVYLGNNRKKSSGSELTRFKDLRLWGYKRSFDQIQSWKHRQLSPFNYQTDELLTYMRLSEGDFQFYNFESSVNPLVNEKLWVVDIQYIQDSSLLMCPQQTYFFNNSCHFNPISKIIASIIPVYNNSELFWFFTLNNTGILDQYIWHEVIRMWISNDNIINSIQNNSSEFLIPATALADQQIYDLKAIITNNASAFSEIQTVKFIPISCKYVVEEEVDDAFSKYNFFNKPQSVNDININLKVKKIDSSCETYYDMLLPNITYQISPQLRRKPNIVITQSSSDSLTVTIPKEEQSKFPLFTDMKIVFSIYWTNSFYKDIDTIEDQQQYTFQNLLYTINFAFDSMTVIPIIEQNVMGALIGDTVVFNSSSSYVTNQPSYLKYQNITFSWICPDDDSTLCENQNSFDLVIDQLTFLNSDLEFEQLYTFQVEINWTAPSGNNSLFYDSVDIVWYNQTRPSFELILMNDKILVSQENQFEIQLDNNLDLTDFDVVWSILPNLTITSLNLTQNDGILTIASNELKGNTLYIIKASINNKDNNLISTEQEFQFTTGIGPTGGIARIFPTNGYLNETELRVSLKRWETLNPPIIYRVWQTDGPTSSTPVLLLTEEWTAINETIYFVAQTSNPFIVELSDNSGEISYSSRIKNALTYNNVSSDSIQDNSSDVQDQNSTNDTSQTSAQGSRNRTRGRTSSSRTTDSTSNETSSNSNSTALLSFLALTRSDYKLKYDYIQQYSDNIFKENANVKSDINLILERLITDSIKLNQDYFINTGNAQIIMKKAAQILSILTKDELNIDWDIINKQIIVMDAIQNSKIYEIVAKEDSKFVEDLAQSLMNIKNLVTYQQINSNSRRLDQQNKNMNFYINYIESYLSKTLYFQCQSLGVDQHKEFKTSLMDIVISKINEYSLYIDTYLSSQDQDKTSIWIDTQGLLAELSSHSRHYTENNYCLQAKFYKKNPLNNKIPVQSYVYSSYLSQLEIYDESNNKIDEVINMNQLTQTYFQINPLDFKNNQTICYQFNDIQQEWEDSTCQTEIIKDEYQVKCTCSRYMDEYLGLFVDLSRQAADPLYKISENSLPSHLIKKDQQSVSENKLGAVENTTLSHFSIVLTLLGIGILVPTLAVYLDKKDMKFASMKIQKGQKFQMIQNIASLSKEPIQYWIYKQDQVMNYNIQSTSFFSHLLFQIHPFINIFTKFEIQESRIQRFSLFFTQLSIYALICALCFGPTYKPDNSMREIYGLDSEDVTRIMWVGLIGMVILLPLPISTKCMKAQLYSKNDYDEKSKDNLGNLKRINTSQQMQQETVEQNNFQYTSSNSKKKMKFNTDNEEIIGAPSPLRSRDQYNQGRELLFIPQWSIFKMILLIISYILCSLASVLIITNNFNGLTSIQNQYCMVGSFFMGFTGSLLFSNMLRILMNSLLIEKAHANELNQFIKFFLSTDALRIYQEIQFVRQADSISTNSLNCLSEKKQISSMDMNDADSQKRLSSKSHRVLEENVIDFSSKLQEEEFKQEGIRSVQNKFTSEKKDAFNSANSLEHTLDRNFQNISEEEIYQACSDQKMAEISGKQKEAALYFPERKTVFDRVKNSLQKEKGEGNRYSYINENGQAQMKTNQDVIIFNEES